MDGDRERQASPSPSASPESPRFYASDAAFAAVVAVLLACGTLLPGSPNGPAQVGVVGYLLLVGGSAALAARRTAPVTALVVAAACMMAYALRVQPETATAFPLLITVFSAATAGRRLWAAAVSAAYLAGVLLVELSDLGTRTPREVVDRIGLLVGWFVAANVAGVVSRQRRAYLRQAEQRAVEAERTREEVALRRAGEERLRIAGSCTTRSPTASRSSRCRPAWPSIWRASEARTCRPRCWRSRTRVRTPCGSCARRWRCCANPAPTTRRARPARQDRRAGRAGTVGRAAGHAGDRGTRRAAAARGGPAAYRIVQEALTNVARHAGPPTSVQVATARRLVVRVEDDGVGRPVATTPDTADGPPGRAPWSGPERFAWASDSPACGSGWPRSAGGSQAGPRTGRRLPVHAELPLPVTEGAA